MDTTGMGSRLRRARNKARMSQAEVGKRVGVSGRTVGNWERGTHFPREHLSDLEELFGVVLDPMTDAPATLSGEGTSTAGDPVGTGVHPDVLAGLRDDERQRVYAYIEGIKAGRGE